MYDVNQTHEPIGAMAARATYEADREKCHHAFVQASEALIRVLHEHREGTPRMHAVSAVTLTHASDLASIRACVAARCLLVPEQATVLLADLDAARARVEAAERVALAAQALELAERNQNPDGTPFRPYQWSGAIEDAESDLAEAIDALRRALGGQGTGGEEAP